MNGLNDVPHNNAWLIGTGMIVRITAILIVIAFSAVAAMTGCGQQAEAPSKERLLERANAYWSAGEARDLNTVYELEAGSLTGALQPDVLRRSLQRARLVGYELGNVEIDGQYAVIEVTTDYNVTGLRSKYTMKRRDHWVFMEGDWYHGKAENSPFLNPAEPESESPPPQEIPLDTS